MADSIATPGADRNAAVGTGPCPATPGGVRRFPPVLQFLTRSSPHLERELRSRSLTAFRRGGRIEQVCAEIHRTAREQGFHATIGVQEVCSRSMPSFPEETVLSAILILDLQFDPDLRETDESDRSSA